VEGVEGLGWEEWVVDWWQVFECFRVRERKGGTSCFKRFADSARFFCLFGGCPDEA
jgi:hypothetical protein